MVTNPFLTKHQIFTRFSHTVLKLYHGKSYYLTILVYNFNDIMSRVTSPNCCLSDNVKFMVMIYLSSKY